MMPTYVPSPIKPLAFFGVDALSTADQQTALQRAFDAAAAEGYSLIADPDANYRHDGVLTLRGVSFDGQGCTFTGLSTGYQAIHAVGSGFTLRNFTTLGAATIRGDGHDFGDGLYLGDPHGQVTATDFVVENVTIDRARDGLGFAGGGILFRNCHRGKLLRPVVRYCKADGVHATDGSSFIDVYGARVFQSGDDGLAVVSYANEWDICNNIRFIDCEAIETGARGCSVVGGSEIHFVRPVAKRCSAPGVYFGSTSDFNGQTGVRNTTASEFLVEDCCTGVGLLSSQPEFNSAQVLLAGRSGEDMKRGVTYSRNIVDCAVSGLIRGAGARASSAVNYSDFTVIRPRVRVELRDILQATDPALRDSADPQTPRIPNGVEHGGFEARVAVRMNNVAGLPFHLTAGSSGLHVVEDIEVSGGRTAAQHPVDAHMYFVDAPGLTELQIERGSFSNGPGRLIASTAASLPVRTRNIYFNGYRLKTELSPVMQNGWFDASLKVYREDNGDILLFGKVQGGSTSFGAIMFSIPDAAPLIPGDQFVVNSSDGSQHTLQVDRNGTTAEVKIVNVTQAAVIFHGFRFPTVA